jgi:pimeloyl-ACP methyl ester carboxylesterase
VAFVTAPDGVKIHFELEGSGPPLLLYHGFSASLDRWRSLGYASELATRYRLVLIDARGHGQSDKPHDVQMYSPDRKTADIIAVLDGIDVAQAAAFGYSAGGRGVYELLQRNPERLSAALIGGFQPYERDFSGRGTRIALLNEGMAALLADTEARTGTEMPEPRRSEFLANDGRALAAATEAASLFSDSYLNVPDASVPTLVFCGTEDEYHDGAGRLAREIGAEFRSLAGLSHIAGQVRADIVLPIAVEFLDRVGSD